MQKAENKSSKAIDNYINEIVKLVFTQYGVELEISEEVVEAFIQNKLQTYNQNGSEGLLKYLVLLNDHTHDAINKISDHLSKETIVIKNLNVFVDAANQHIDFLSSIFNKIVYEDCKFYTNQYSTSSKLEIALSAQDKIFEKCSFDVNIALITDFNDEEYNEYLFNNCEFSATVEIRRTRAEAAYKDEEMAVLSPYKAIFLNPKHIKNLVVERIYGALCLFGAQGNLTKVQKLEIKNCEFTKEFELRANVESLKILNTQFNHFANFDNCVFEEISCKQTKFKEATSFKECVFGKENSESGTAIFDSVGFFGKANFYKSVFNSPLELSSAEFFSSQAFYIHNL